VAQFGSDRNIASQNMSVVTDPNGNLIVSADNSFGASPLGVAALTQSFIGVPNGTFNLLPFDPQSAITVSNPLPYWDISADDGFTSTMDFDDTLQAWSVQIDPTAVGTALGTAVLKTKIPIVNDEGLLVRHFVSSTLINAAKAAGTDKWTMTLTSQYYDTTNTAIGTAWVIGSIGERGTATNISGYTNASGAIPASAGSLEIAYSMVVGTASPTYVQKIKSITVATEYGVIGGGGGGTTTIDTFTESGTWTRPAGVEYVTVVAWAGGQGGQGGGCVTGRAILPPVFTANGGVGGATGYWAIVKDVYVGGTATATVSVGIGAGGSGGTAFSLTKPVGNTTTISQTNGANGSSGGNTTFGSLLVVPGARTAPTGYFGIDSAAGTTGGTQGAGASGGAGGGGATHLIGGTYVGAPYTTLVKAGAQGLPGTASGGQSRSTGNFGAESASNGLLGGGGGGGGGSAAATALAGNGGQAAPTGGGGGGGVAVYWPTTATVTGTAGNGGSAGANTGGGGGGGGAIVTSTAGTTSGASQTNYSNSSITIVSGAGGNGGSGLLKVIYVA
jgi:hypothetical protein